MSRYQNVRRRTGDRSKPKVSEDEKRAPDLTATENEVEAALLEWEGFSELDEEIEALTLTVNLYKEEARRRHEEALRGEFTTRRWQVSPGIGIRALKRLTELKARRREILKKVSDQVAQYAERVRAQKEAEPIPAEAAAEMPTDAQRQVATHEPKVTDRRPGAPPPRESARAA